MSRSHPRLCDILSRLLRRSRAPPRSPKLELSEREAFPEL